MNESHILKLAEMIKQRNLLNSLIENQLEQRTTRSKPKKANGKNGRQSQLEKQVAQGRRLHGRYLGHIRTLTKAQRKEVGKLRAEKGYLAAIRAAKSLKAAKEA